MLLNLSRALDEILAVKSLLRSPKRWTKDLLARDAKGTVIHHSSPKAVCWCLDGAFCKVLGTNYGSLYSTSPGHKFLENYIRETYGIGVVGFNDFTNFTELHNALDGAIARIKSLIKESA